MKRNMKKTQANNLERPKMKLFLDVILLSRTVGLLTLPVSL